MIKLSLLILMGSLLANAGRVEPAPPDAAVTFVPLHVFIDPHGKALACYQVRIIATAGDVKLVGIEGGDSPAFAKAPYYDPRALQTNRIVIGAYSLDPNLPAGNTRVATLMLRVAGSVVPVYESTLQVAGTTDGTPIDAAVSLVPASRPNPVNGAAR